MNPLAPLTSRSLPVLALVAAAGVRAPGQEFAHGAAIGAARVRVADVGCEEFEEADARLLAGVPSIRARSNPSRRHLD
jgi:hypothetical protein